MKDALARLYRTMDGATQRRLKFAVLGMLVGAALDVAGVAMVLPLMQAITDPGTQGGFVGKFSGLFGDPESSTLIISMAAIVFVLFVAKGVYMLVFEWWMLGVVNREAAAAATDLFERYMSADYTFHLRRNSAEILRTVDRAAYQAYASATMALLDMCTQLVTVSAVLAVLVVARPVPAVAAVLYFGIVGAGVYRLISSRSRVAGTALMTSSRASNQAALQGLGGIKEVYVRGTAPYFSDSFRDAQYDQAEARRAQLFLGLVPRYSIEMLFVLGVAVLCAVIYSQGSVEAGTATLGLFLAAGFRLLPSLSSILAGLSTLRVSDKAIDLVLSDIEDLPAPVIDWTPVEPLAVSQGIEVSSLTYRYPGTDVDVLEDVSFAVPAGSSIAIVGSTGAGKTTLVDLVLGLLTPTGGMISIDGVDMADVRRRWQQSIGLVPQDVFLFDDTLRKNIVFGSDPDGGDLDRISESVSRAQLDELISGLADGLETVVGERGVRLSGGQRQRIGIARALYLRPQLVMLDEATSALDNETERRITETIEALHGEVTMMVVAHRLSTVRRCDQLVFMANGRVESIGTFDEVRASNPTFDHLVRLGSLDGLDGIDGESTGVS